MGTRTEYGPATFCWVNLSTPDPAQARRFYGEVFGWHYEDRTADGFWFARKHGANVAAIYPRDEQERAHGLPPHWNNYVNVSDADAAVARALELGGAVFDGPFDVSDAGRTAVLLDPTGAMFWVWQPRAHIGAGHVNDVGSLTWNELGTDDPERAITFYSALFGWHFQPRNSGADPAYWVIANPAAAGGRNGGLREAAGGEHPDVDLVLHRRLGRDGCPDGRGVGWQRPARRGPPGRRRHRPGRRSHRRRLRPVPGAGRRLSRPPPTNRGDLSRWLTARSGGSAATSWRPG